LTGTFNLSQLASLIKVTPMANNKGFNLVLLILINISFITKEAAGSPISYSTSGSSSPFAENENNPGVEFHVYAPKNEESIGEAMEEELLNEAAAIENQEEEEEEDACPNGKFLHGEINHFINFYHVV
jgi:hypothetical protein